MATRAPSRTSQKKPPAGPSSKSDRRVDKCEVFYTSLSDKLDALEQAVQPKWLTLEWVSLAVDFMRSTFSDMMILFEDVRTHMPDVNITDEFWIEEYMEESMKLLDVCNVLRPAVSRFEHFMMCLQLVVQTIQRCGAGSQGRVSDCKALIAALQSCESELNQLVHLPLTVESSSLTTSQTSHLWLASKSSADGLLRHASDGVGEKFAADGISAAGAQPSPGRNGSYKTAKNTVALTLVMRATQETTDFIASVLIWALKRDPSSHPASTNWQQNLDVFRGDESLWSPSFRRLQERLRKELFEILRDERSGMRRNCRQFVFEELKLVEVCTADLGVEIEELSTRERTGEEPSIQLPENLVQQLMELLDKTQVRLEKVSSQVNQLFDELVQARKKLLDAAQRPGIHRAHTF